MKYAICFLIISLCSIAAFGRSEVSIISVSRISDKCVIVYGLVNPGGDSYLVKDCGDTKQLIGKFELGFIDQLHFTDENIAWGVSNGNIVKLQIDGVSLMTTVIFKKEVDWEFKSAYFVDRITGYGVTSKGSVFSTANGGQSWLRYDLKKGLDLLKIRFTNSKFGWIIGRNGGTNSTFVTSDSGQTWTLFDGNRDFDAFFWGESMPACGVINRKEVACLNSIGVWRDTRLPVSGIFDQGNNRIWLTGDDVYVSSSQGQNWQKVFQANRSIDAGIFVNENVGWIWGVKALLFTSNAGKTWGNEFLNLERVVDRQEK